MTDHRYHHGNLAAAAVAAAEEEIAAHGIAAASLRKVADRAGVSHTAVGRCFGDKAGLLAAVAAEGYRRLGEALGAAGTDMRAMGRAYVEFATRRPALFAVMFQPAVYRADDPGVASARARTAAMLRAGVGQRADASTADAAFGAWAFVHGIAALVLGGAIEADATELYERAVDAFFPGGLPAA
jgi:AcrR family transcriptional regulator